MKTPNYENTRNLCKSKGEEKLRWDNSTVKSGFKIKCECGQTGVNNSYFYIHKYWALKEVEGFVKQAARLKQNE